MTGAEINWQEAVARLARERALVVNWLGVLERNRVRIGAAEIDRLAVIYGEAKAEYDGVIAGLVVALARKGQPASLADLQERLGRGVAKREAFCAGVGALVPARSGERSVIADIVKGAVGPLIQAVQAIWLRARDDDALTRKTIETQLEAARWPAFGL